MRVNASAGPLSRLPVPPIGVGAVTRQIPRRVVTVAGGGDAVGAGTVRQGQAPGLGGAGGAVHVAVLIVAEGLAVSRAARGRGAGEPVQGVVAVTCLVAEAGVHVVVIIVTGYVAVIVRALRPIRR